MVDPWSFAIGTGISIVSQPKLIQKLVALTKRKRKILVLGASGAGKTQLIRSLKEDVVASIPASERTFFTEKTKIVFDNIPFLFNDTPGLVRHEGERREAIKNAIKTGVFGILNVVCFGYHEGEAEAKDVIRRSKGSEIVNPYYLEKRRAAELDLLPEWVFLIDKDVTNWVITIVTKADLWRPDKDGEIYHYYTKGPYYEALGNLPLLVNHAIVPYCSTIESFYRRVTLGHLGNTEKQRMRNYVLAQLLSAAGKTK